MRHRRQVAGPARTRPGRRPGTRRPRSCRRCRSRCRRTRPRSPGRSAPLSARQDAMCAWWCWTPTSSRSVSVGEVERVLGRQVVRVQVVRDQLGLDVEQAPEVLDALGERPQRRRRSPGRRCAGRRTRGRPWPGRRCSSARRRRRAPAARSRCAQPDGSGAYPRDLRSTDSRPRNGRTTESSVRMWIARSWTQEGVGDAGQPVERVVVVVGDRLVADVAAGQARSGGRSRGAAGGAAACTGA